MPFITPLIEIAVAGIAAVGSFVGGSLLVQGLVMAGIGLATSYLLNKLMPKPDASSVVPAGVQFERQYGANVPRQVACGYVGIAGHDVYVNTYDTGNKSIQQVYVVSDFYCTGLNRIAINGEWVSLSSGSYPVASGSTVVPQGGSWNGLIEVTFFDGRQSAASSILVAHANPSPRWSTDNIGKGIAYIVVAMTYDQDNNNSFPDFFFEVKGAPLYDFRKDTTAGGSGSHRWADQTTWEFSENPIIQAYNYRRGFSIAGDLFCGMDIAAADLPLDKWTAAANVCDEIQGDSVERYKCSAILSAESTHSDNLQALSISCGSMDIDTVEGSWPLVGSDQASVITFTDEDIDFTANNFKWKKLRSMGELVNSVTGNYPEPSQLWSMIGYTGIVSSTFVTVDRRTRDLNIDFPQVRWSRQATQLASIYMYENRYQGTATLTLGPRFQTIETGDWITWVSARYGFTKQFIVTGKSLAALDAEKPRFPVLQLQERNSDIYAGVSPGLPVMPLPPGTPVYMSEVQSFSAFAVTMTGDSGKLLPAIRVSWLPIDDATVTNVELIYYPVAQGITYATYQTVDASKSLVNVINVVGNTDYFIAARIITDPPRSTAFNAGAGVTTPDVGTGNTLVDLDISIQDQLTKITDQVTDKIAEFQDIVNGLLSNNDSRAWMDKKMLRSQLYATAGNARAEIAVLQTVIADNQLAFAAYQVQVSATFGPDFSSVNSVSSAIATIDGYAAAQYAVTLDVNGYATGFNLFNGGAGLSATVFVTDTFKVAKPSVTGGAPVPIFTIGTIAGVPKIGIRGDMIIDGSITATMMTVGTLSAISGNMGTLTVGKIQSTDNKMIIDATNKQIIFLD